MLSNEAMTCKRQTIIAMIELGYDNAVISKAIRTSKSNVRNVRVEYNSAATNPIHSCAEKPKQGTQRRMAYDYIKSNPNASNKEVAEATGVNRGTCSKVRKRYFWSIPMNSAPLVVSRSVSLDELVM